MKRSFLLAVALLGLLGLLPAPRAQAVTPSPTPQPSIPSPGPNITPQPGIPTPAPSTIFPVNQPATFRYSDSDGFGTITFVDLGLDTVTAFDLLRVTLAQNGATYNGSGIATPIPGAQRPLTNLVSFTVAGSDGRAYFYEGKMGLGVEFQGQGTYHPVGNPAQSASWGLLFVPGVPPPGPPTATLSLGLDRGCGSTYAIGSPQVITYSSSVDDTVTLQVQRPDGTFTLFASQPVIGGQTYTYSATVGLVLGFRTLILRNASGAQVACSFTGVNNQ